MRSTNNRGNAGNVALIALVITIGLCLLTSISGQAGTDLDSPTGDRVVILVFFGYSDGAPNSAIDIARPLFGGKDILPEDVVELGDSAEAYDYLVAQELPRNTELIVECKRPDVLDNQLMNLQEFAAVNCERGLVAVTNGFID